MSSQRLSAFIKSFIAIRCGWRAAECRKGIENNNAYSAPYYSLGNANHLLAISHYRYAEQSSTEKTLETDLHRSLVGVHVASLNAGTSFLRP